MKSIKQDSDDLRPEYMRSDFRELVRGKHAWTQLEFAELVSLLIACVGEDEGLKFTHHSIGNYLADHQCGDWTYEIDNANQITLRYWLNELKKSRGTNIEPSLHHHCSGNLQDLLVKHVRLLKNRVGALSK